MRDFFRGWRRKAGVVTLVMASVVMGMWVRSGNISDFISFPIGARQNMLFSMDGEIHWMGLTNGGRRWRFESFNSSPVVSVDDVVDLYTGYKKHAPKDWYVPYWSLAIPSTLLSTYLILWKPQRAEE